MYIRQTKTGSSPSGEPYHTFRLVASERIDDKVRQRTLLNLGKHFSVPREQWPDLCARIEEILSGQLSLIAPPSEVEELAQRYASLLIAKQPAPPTTEEKKDQQYEEIDVDSLELIRPRSIGVEHAGFEAMEWLELPRILEEVGLSGVQRAAVLGSIIGRMSGQVSELSTWRWLGRESGLGELLSFDYEGLPLMTMYRAADVLTRNRQRIEEALFSRITDLFSLPATVTLYDLTNTYFEGDVPGNSKAARGHSKEKRTDRPLATLGLVLDGSGFIRRSRMFEGNVSEGGTLESMLSDLAVPAGAMVVMDRGIATQANIDWLVEQGYRYLVVSREQSRVFEKDRSVEVVSASKQTIQVHRVENEGEVRLYCRSEARAAKEEAMTERFTKRFEDGLRKIAASLGKPHGIKQRDKVRERIGRLKEKSRGIGRHYHVDLILDEKRNTVKEITWERKPVEGTMLTHPGVYCLRTNELRWDESTLWRTYTMLTDVEAVFRCLKSELGLRPVHHHKEERAEGHLFITVLAYQVVQAIRRKLKLADVNLNWEALREIFRVQRRITATFTRKDGRALHVRKATMAEPELKNLYDVLEISDSPGGVTKMIY